MHLVGQNIGALFGKIVVRHSASPESGPVLSLALFWFITENTSHPHEELSSNNYAFKNLEQISWSVFNKTVTIPQQTQREEYFRVSNSKQTNGNPAPCLLTGL